MNETLKNVDHTALRTNQAVIIILNILAFILNLPWLAALVGLVMLVGTLLKIPGFGILYRRILKPLGLLTPDILLDNPEPHRFALGFGGVVMAGSTVALFAGAPGLGWALTWLVVVLAALNLFGGFCLGCSVYYWLNRLNVPGFKQSQLEGTFPGARSKVRSR